MLRGELRLRLNSRWNLGLEVTFSVVGKCKVGTYVGVYVYVYGYGIYGRYNSRYNSQVHTVHICILPYLRTMYVRTTLELPRYMKFRERKRKRERGSLFQNPKLN